MAAESATKASADQPASNTNSFVVNFASNTQTNLFVEHWGVVYLH